MEEPEILEPTPILSHEFHDGDIFYLIQTPESDPVWHKETEVENSLIKAYWHNLETIDKQDQRVIEPGELIALIPNAYENKMNWLIQRETDVDPLMVVPPRKENKTYQMKYIDLLQEVYMNGAPA